jgi:thioredoxin reductase (NADPH)
MAPIEVNGGAAAEKPSKHNKVVIIGSGPAGRESHVSSCWFWGELRY